MPIIEFLVISACVYYFLRMLIRLFLPMIFQKIVSKAQQQGQQQYREPRRPENKVRVDYAPKTKSSIPDSEGDFIDYEEIK